MTPLIFQIIQKHVLICHFFYDTIYKMVDSIDELGLQKIDCYILSFFLFDQTSETKNS